MMTRVAVCAVAVSVLALGAGSLPAHAQPIKQEPASAPGNGADAKAQSIEAPAGRAGRLAEARGGLGAYYDAAAGEHVLVMPAGSSLTADEASRAVGAKSRVERRTLTRAIAGAIQARIAARSFRATAAAYGYASYTDLETGRVVVQTDAPPAVTDELVREFGAVVELRAEHVQDAFTRAADVPPFWGASFVKSGLSQCTSGFVVQKAGLRYLTAAAHCFELGANVVTAAGNLSVGTVTQRGPLASFDMELIGGKSYGRSIFIGAASSSANRTVIGAGDPTPGVLYCFVATGGEKCGQKVISTSAQLCTPTGCTSPVIAFAGSVQAGESGAPFYLPSATSSASIRGMIIGGAGSTTGYAEKWSRISSHFGVSIVT